MRIKNKIRKEMMNQKQKRKPQNRGYLGKSGEGGPYTYKIALEREMKR